ncbi:MAG: hypothetical protein KGD68_04345 [Candidatus Lokiarchaeota archaeon]|nr:hypothetical protein [Candidatus Lokiarchaeota archaeon]
MIEYKNLIIIELEKPLSEALKDKIKEPSKIDSVQIPFTLKETNKVEKERLIKKWKKSEGFFYLKPNKFEFSLKNL